jgi:hypothetical protein
MRHWRLHFLEWKHFPEKPHMCCLLVQIVMGCREIVCHVRFLLTESCSCMCVVVAADRDELQQWAEEEAEQEAEQEEMLDSPAKRQRREEGSAFNYRSAAGSAVRAGTHYSARPAHCGLTLSA